MADRRRLLARLTRLYAAERQTALTELAARRAEQQRMEEIACRSRDLVGSNALADGHRGGGADLRDALAFQARLVVLAGQARQLGRQADIAENAARTALAHADRRLDRARERLDHTQRQASGRELARSLLNSLHQPRRPL